MEQQVERLTSAGFQLLPTFEITTHYVVTRDGFVALVERRLDGGMGHFGAPGMLRDGMFAALVWRGEAAVFVTKGKEWQADREQVAALRKFDADLRTALELHDA